jgi:hypothetical protein
VSDSHPPGLWFVPGDAVLARSGSLILLSSAAEDGFLDELLGGLACLNKLLDGLAHEFDNLIEDAINNYGAGQTGRWGEQDPAVVAIGPARQGLTATVSGTAWAEITTVHGLQRLEAGQPSMLLRSMLSAPVIAVHCGVAADLGRPCPDRFSRLDGGTVRAGGFTYYPDHAAALAGAQEGAEARPTLPLASAQHDEQRGAEAPIVSGVYCKSGHFNDPQAHFCAVCGISMNQLTPVPRPGRRPPLGVLVLDDGSVFQLDSDYVIGCNPASDASVAVGQARPLRTDDGAGTVSQVHARIQLDGWRVLVTDLGSASGTRIRLPGQPADQALTPRTPVQLLPGSHVDLGGSGFRYESHRGGCCDPIRPAACCA